MAKATLTDIIKGIEYGDYIVNVFFITDDYWVERADGQGFLPVRIYFNFNPDYYPILIGPDPELKLRGFPVSDSELVFSSRCGYYWYEICYEINYSATIRAIVADILTDYARNGFSYRVRNKLDALRIFIEDILDRQDNWRIELSGQEFLEQYPLDADMVAKNSLPALQRQYRQLADSLSDCLVYGLDEAVASQYRIIELEMEAAYEHMINQ
jgi:hypothetical protein